MEKRERIRKAVTLGEETRHVFVATADARGLPHVAAAGRIELSSEGRVGVSAWFCPGTVLNVQQNRRIALVVWEAARDQGYQLLGEVEDLQETAFMDGYVPQLEKQPPPPQVERRLVVRVDKVLNFTHAPHGDQED
jgi:hypothetical protein